MKHAFEIRRCDVLNGNGKNIILFEYCTFLPLVDSSISHIFNCDSLISATPFQNDLDRVRSYDVSIGNGFVLDFVNTLRAACSHLYKFVCVCLGMREWFIENETRR